MSDPRDDEIPESTTWGAHMRAIRREQSLIIQTQTRIVELLGRMQGQLTNLQSDVTLLENHNISRHGEVLNILERLDHAGIPQPGRAFGSVSALAEGAWPDPGSNEPPTRG